MKRVLSISHLILPLLALASALCLSAQTIVVDKPTLVLQGQVGGSPVTQTINITSSNGSAQNFTLSYPSYPWLKVNGQAVGFAGTTPAAVTVSADPTGVSAGTLSANIVVQGGSSQSNSPIAVTFSVSAIGANPASLAFSYTVGTGSFPAAQSITLSAAAATQCTAAFTSAAGWFTLQQTACVAPGSLTVLINTAVVNGLAPGTYSGTVTVTPAGQGPAASVSLTLTVAPTPPVTVDPASLIFNWQTGTANPSQVFTVYASQPLSVGVTSKVDTGNWSFSTINTGTGTISATTGNLPITVTVNPNGIAPGTYAGHLTVLTPGGSPSQTNVPVTLLVSNTALLNVPNATLNFTSQVLGSAPAAQTVNITSTGADLSYSVSTGNYNPNTNSTWLSVPNAGSTAAPLSVSVNPAGLPPGTYSATINVLSATAGSTAQQIPVVLKVTNDPTISASVTELKFPYQIGQTATVASRSVKLTSITGVPLNYTASLTTATCTGAAWLQAGNANSSLTGVAPDTLTVSVTTTGLAAASSPCTGIITINATNPATGAAAVGSPISIPVTLLISTTAQLVLTPPDPPIFTVGIGSPSPAPQNIVLSSTNSDVLSYSVVSLADNNLNWLAATPQTSTTSGSNPLKIFADSTGLAAGTYTGKVTVTVTNQTTGGTVANSPVIIPVTLNVTTGSLTVSSSDLTFPDQTLGGPAPPAQTVTIGSTGQPLNYTAVANSNNPVAWLSISPASGNTSTSGVLTVSVDGSKLTPGATYTGTIQLTSPGAGNSPVITVHFRVNPGTFSALPATLTFTQVASGAAPAAQSIAVTGSAPLNFTTGVTTQNGINWLKATPASGTTPGTVQVAIDTTVALGVGQYLGTVTVTSVGATGSPATVQVVLNVVAPAVLTASPASLDFAFTIGLTVPTAKNLQVSATGATGTVPLTAQVQYDGAAGQSWLAITPATGNAPVTFAVSVLTTGLAAGSYSGKIIVNAPNALVAATVPVTLIVVAVPKPVVAAVANAANYSTGAVSPGENIVIFGTGVGPADITVGAIVNNAFTTIAGNTRVLFDNVPAPVIYASTGQTSVMVPYGVFGRSTTSIVVEYSGVQSAPLTYNVALTAPGIYTMNKQGTGPGAILNQDGITVNSSSTPEKAGNVIAIYMTGEGQTSPQGTDGAIIPAVVSALKHPLQTVSVTIGGIDAVVAYAGSAPGIVSGVMQVNAIIPLTVASGTQPVVVTVGSAKSQSGASAATVAVQ